jgi:leucyl-tRNA synthetase
LLSMSSITNSGDSERLSLDWKILEAKWQKRWEESRIFEADKAGLRKFFITIAFPYPNMPFHVGHGRPYTLTDVYARYMRMRGYNVLFPMAFHYTGTPVLAIAKRVATKDLGLIEELTKIYNVPTKQIEKFVEPLNIANYFRDDDKETMRAMGYSIDWRREFTTIDPQFSRFIGWQFRKLRSKGLIKQGSHPVGWCPNDSNPMGQHDTKGDVEPDIGEMILIKFRLNDIIIPTGTLRSETIFGVTNIWVRPDVDYVRAEVDGESWIVSRECSDKLVLLGKRVRIIDSIPAKTLVGKYVVNPVTYGRIPILPASFVDPRNATGIVMSVPGHAPFDWIALEELKKAPRSLISNGVEPKTIQDIEPISVISLKGHSAFPAFDVLNRVGAKDQMDEKVDEATKEIYSEEFHLGTMRENTGLYAGLTVSEARTRIETDLLAQGKADRMYELLNRPIYCRCGTEVVVKVLEDQWFIDYSNEDWKSLARECLKQMKIAPEDIRAEFSNVIEWLREKACARKQGLGTRLPWDQEWIVESLSDSTIYMAYYILAKYINSENIRAENLTDAVFDYVFLGEGEAEEIAAEVGLDIETLTGMRSEFLYFYPLDSRNSGRDLVPNHLTFFIFNHVGIFPRELWPKQIVVTGSVLMEGKKMSKSLGNIIPLKAAIRDYAVDPFRLAILSTAELLQDADFSPSLAKALRERLERLYASACEMAVSEIVSQETILDRWILSRLQGHILAVTKTMDNLRFREAIQNIIYLLDQDIQWYLRRAEVPQDFAHSSALKKVLETRILLLAPFTPHICEELWEILGKKGFASTAPWPEYDEAKVDYKAMLGEELVTSLREDTVSILNAMKLTPKRVSFYAAAPWKWEIYLKALELARDENLKVSPLMKDAMNDKKLKREGKQIAAFVQEIVEDLTKASKEMISRRLSANQIDEFQIISEARSFLAKELRAEIDIYRENDPDKRDPKNRGRLAEPYRPAIYVE